MSVFFECSGVSKCSFPELLLPENGHPDGGQPLSQGEKVQDHSGGSLGVVAPSRLLDVSIRMGLPGKQVARGCSRASPTGPCDYVQWLSCEPTITTPESTSFSQWKWPYAGVQWEAVADDLVVSYLLKWMLQLRGLVLEVMAKQPTWIGKENHTSVFNWSISS